MKAWRYRPGPGYSWLYSEPQYILDDIKEMQAEDSYEIECVEMSEQQLDALPEHEGW